MYPCKEDPGVFRFTLISEPGLVSFGFRLDPFCGRFSRALAVLVELVLPTVAAVLAVVGELAVVVAVSGGNSRSSC